MIKKIVEKVLSLNSLSHYKGIIESVSDNMQTNISLDSNSLLQLLGYKDALSTIHQYQLKGEDATLADGGSYQIVTSKHILKIQNIIRKALGMKEIKTLKTNAYLLDGDDSLKENSSQVDSQVPVSEEAPVYQDFYQQPVVPSSQDTGVVTPQSSVAPVTPVAPAATESSSVTPAVPSE
ncbi:Cell envelope-transcriptional attenuator LytR-CpsA-Psr [Streptococcus sp. ZB199]|nr:Cell envelope-transcriptional attenuator LytR-CpsA-Psr [Streptococcus sp. ZB199]